MQARTLPTVQYGSLLRAKINLLALKVAACSIGSSLELGLRMLTAEQLSAFFAGLKNLPETPQGIASFGLLILGVLVLVFFRQANPTVKLLALMMFIVGLAGVFYFVSLTNTENDESSAAEINALGENAEVAGMTPSGQISSEVTLCKGIDWVACLKERK